jgi:hypothetical protein
MLQKGFVPDDVFFFNLITVLLPRIVNKIHVTLDNLRAQFHGEMLLSRSIPADKS